MGRDLGSVLQATGSAGSVEVNGMGESMVAVPPSRSTPLLRRCTALATRARVDLMMTSRQADCAELSEVLTELASWEGAELLDPDPTMLALAAAALQDLREGLDEAHRIALEEGISAVLDVLHRTLSCRSA